VIGDPNATCLANRVCDEIAMTDRPAHVSTADIVAMAAAALELPPPVPRTEPADHTWVALATYLRIDPALWHPTSATATVRGQTVTATARPTRVVWDMGEATITCTGPCAYTYRHASLRQPGRVYKVTATLYYEIDWSCSGACDAPRGRLGELPASGRTTLGVNEIQAIVNP
jgi:hypothetical protein